MSASSRPINPNSNIGLYNGSGYNGNAEASTFTALQSAIWDTATTRPVISNSFGDSQSMTPDSPFYAAYWQLYVDAALNNQTVFTALGDGGSGNETGNGLTNVEYNVTSPYACWSAARRSRPWPAREATPRSHDDRRSRRWPAIRGTIWQLVAGGLTTLPARCRTRCSSSSRRCGTSTIVTATDHRHIGTSTAATW